jgi:hypothetical protein
MPIMPGGIVCSTVLPGFQWRLADLDRQPLLKTLTTDLVYQGYVRLEYQQQQAQVMQERQRTEQAELRIQQAQGQVERLTAQLRALGIDPENDAEILRSSKT